MSATQPPADHVVLISVDAMRWDFLTPGWPAPTMQQQMAHGAVIPRLRSIAPSLTYPAHATLATGALPARHGVVYNRPFEPEGASGRWLWEAEHIQVPTLWDAVRDAGGTSAALTWPVTVGAPIDWNIPEVWDPTDEASQLEVLAQHTTPPELLEELRRDVTGEIPPDAFRGYDLIRADLAGAIAAHLLETRTPTLLAVHLVAVDAQQHEEGRDGPRVWRALAAADRAVGRMVEAAERAGIADRTAFIAMGDHGFVDVHTKLAPNVWLAEAGLRPVDPKEGGWEATFHVADGAAFLHVSAGSGEEAGPSSDAGLSSGAGSSGGAAPPNDPTPYGDKNITGESGPAAEGPEGATPHPEHAAPSGESFTEETAEALEKRVRRILALLPWRVQRLFTVAERETLDAMGASPNARLALSGRPGVTFVEDAEGDDVRPGSGGAHGHLPDLPEVDAALVAWGAGIRPGSMAPEAELTDVAPLAAHLLGLDLPPADGIVLRGLLEEPREADG